MAALLTLLVVLLLVEGGSVRPFKSYEVCPNINLDNADRKRTFHQCQQSAAEAVPLPTNPPSARGTTITGTSTGHFYTAFSSAGYSTIGDGLEALQGDLPVSLLDVRSVACESPRMLLFGAGCGLGLLQLRALNPVATIVHGVNAAVGLRTSDVHGGTSLHVTGTSTADLALLRAVAVLNEVPMSSCPTRLDAGNYLVSDSGSGPAAAAAESEGVDLRQHQASWFPTASLVRDAESDDLRTWKPDTFSLVLASGNAVRTQPVLEIDGAAAGMHRKKSGATFSWLAKLLRVLEPGGVLMVADVASTRAFLNPPVSPGRVQLVRFARFPFIDTPAGRAVFRRDKVELALVAVADTVHLLALKGAFSTIASVKSTIPESVESTGESDTQKTMAVVHHNGKQGLSSVGLALRPSLVSLLEYFQLHGKGTVRTRNVTAIEGLVKIEFGDGQKAGGRGRGRGRGRTAGVDGKRRGRPMSKAGGGGGRQMLAMRAQGHEQGHGQTEEEGEGEGRADSAGRYLGALLKFLTRCELRGLETKPA